MVLTANLKILIQSETDVALMLPENIKSVHVCNQTYLIVGAYADVEAFLKAHPELPTTDCHFPKDIWKTEYRYLGDFQINQPIQLDLRLIENTQAYSYSCVGQLPTGLIFHNGFLTGQASEATPIIHFFVHAENGDKNFEIKYMIRFFESVNSAKSFTDQDFVKLGYGDKLVDYNPSEIYYRVFATKKSNLSALEEAKLAAKKIFAKAAGKTVFLFISGGVDSQSMTQAFVQAKVPFQAILMVDKNGCNAADVVSARRFTKKLNVSVTEFEFDYIQFIKNYSYVEMAKTYRFNNPEYGILLHLMDRFKGYGVYAGRPISIGTVVSGEQVIGLAGDETWSKARYLERTGQDGCPEFLIHTPELVDSFLNTQYAKNYPATSKWNYESKVKLLREAGFDVEEAPSEKFTGFENLYQYFAETSFGNEIWLHHRGPLKLMFPHAKFRNAIQVQQGQIVSNQKLILKPHEDGFSFNYLKKNSITSFH